MAVSEEVSPSPGVQAQNLDSFFKKVTPLARTPVKIDARGKKGKKPMQEHKENTNSKMNSSKQTFVIPPFEAGKPKVKAERKKPKTVVVAPSDLNAQPGAK